MSVYVLSVPRPHRPANRTSSRCLNESASQGRTKEMNVYIRLNFVLGSARAVRAARGPCSSPFLPLPPACVPRVPGSRTLGGAASRVWRGHRAALSHRVFLKRSDFGKAQCVTGCRVTKVFRNSPRHCSGQVGIPDIRASRRTLSGDVPEVGDWWLRLGVPFPLSPQVCA